MSRRICVNCMSENTHIRKNGIEQWYTTDTGYLCMSCYGKLIQSPKWNHIRNKERNLIYNPRRLLWSPSGKYILLKENPRKGVCEKCHRKVGEGVKRTSIHHIQYHNDDPLRDTVELCISCHRREHIR